MSNLGVAWFDVLLSKDGIPFTKIVQRPDTASVGTVDMTFPCTYINYETKPYNL